MFNCYRTIVWTYTSKLIITRQDLIRCDIVDSFELASLQANNSGQCLCNTNVTYNYKHLENPELSDGYT